MFNLIWSVKTGFQRTDGWRREFGVQCWSANKVNFDPIQMPDPYPQTLFHGSLGIVECLEDVVLPQVFSLLNDPRMWSLGGVVDAMYVGIFFSYILREHPTVLAPGSLGPVQGVPVCDLKKFCPTLFFFSGHPQASLSLGIERIVADDGSIPLKKGSKILVCSGS